MQRIALKIIGASGQGIDSVGEVLGKALKRSGYCVFGYREYPSLIKGGHASYQLDVSAEAIESSTRTVDLILGLNHHVLEKNIGELKPGGILLHSTPNWRFRPADEVRMRDRGLTILELPVETTLRALHAAPILGNILLSSFVWSILGQEKELLATMVGERFAKKKDLLALNMACIDAGFDLHAQHDGLRLTMPKPKKSWSKHLLLSGSKAMGLGVIASGVRVFAGYPMTPASPLLSYVAAVQNQTRMVIKQAEDEITAAQIVSGAMYAGTRALTATSGGGFDLMSETLSMNAIIENPTVFVLAQRPGPATGLPTWTAQGDLLMAVHTGHGEFTRCVMSVANAEDAFSLVGDAFNIAERFQISVILLTDKHIAEGLYTQAPFKHDAISIDRGSIIQQPSDVVGTKRYDPQTPTGVSPRWLPGTQAMTYAAQGDEHDANGTVDESADNAVAQMEKRLRKQDALLAAVPEPRLFRHNKHGWTEDAKASEPVETLLIGWGSTKSAVLDTFRTETDAPSSLGYLHFTYLWPLKTERLLALAASAKRIILIEGNATGQLGQLIRQTCGLHIETRILKYDGRPFFVDELAEKIDAKLNTHSS